MSKCLYCNKSIKGSTDRMMSYRINAITKHERECSMNPKNKLSNKSTVNLKKKTSMAFTVLKKQSEGYRTVRLDDGREYDLIGVDVITKDGDNVSIRLEILPDGLHNLYVASDNYIIEPPAKNEFRLIGKLVKRQTKSDDVS